MLQNLKEITYNTADSALRPILQPDTALVMGEAKEAQSSLCRGIMLQMTQGEPFTATPQMLRRLQAAQQMDKLGKIQGAASEEWWMYWEAKYNSVEQTNSPGQSPQSTQRVKIPGRERAVTLLACQTTAKWVVVKTR